MSKYDGAVPPCHIENDDSIVIAQINRELATYRQLLANIKLRDGIRWVIPGEHRHKLCLGCYILRRALPWFSWSRLERNNTIIQYLFLPFPDPYCPFRPSATNTFRTINPGSCSKVRRRNSGAPLQSSPSVPISASSSVSYLRLTCPQRAPSFSIKSSASTTTPVRPLRWSFGESLISAI